METREIKISLETATRWYNGNDKELKQLALQTYPELLKKELPKSWEELGKFNGYYVGEYCTIKKFESSENFVTTFKTNENIFATENQAISHGRAAAQLSQLMQVYNDGWVADWSDENQKKFSIKDFKGKLIVENSYTCKFFLTFKSRELAEEFLENFKQLIDTYYNF
jgi:hypothetical protein